PGDLLLLIPETPRLLTGRAWTESQRLQRARLAVDRALLPRQFLQLLQRLRTTTTAALRLLDLLRVAQQRERQAVERVHCLRGLLRRHLSSARLLRLLQPLLRTLHRRVRPVQRRTDVLAHHPGFPPGL